MVETVADAALPAAGAIVAVIAPAAAPPAASNTVEKHFQIGLLHAIWLRDPDFFVFLSIKSIHFLSEVSFFFLFFNTTAALYFF